MARNREPREEPPPPENNHKPQSLGAFLRDEARFAATDIRQKVVEEPAYGRAVTPRFMGRDQARRESRFEDLYGHVPSTPTATSPADNSRREARFEELYGRMPEAAEDTAPASEQARREARFEDLYGKSERRSDESAPDREQPLDR